MAEGGLGGPAREESSGVDASARQGRRVVHEGRIVRLNVDTVRFPDGSLGELELVEHPGAAAVLPVAGSPEDADPEILLVRQYRYAGGGLMYEVPAGIPDAPDESWESCARRELEEETGFRPGRLTPLTRIHTTPGFCDEVIHIFLATELERGTASHDSDEFIEVERLPFSRACEMVRRGRITDGKSVTALLYARAFLLSGA